MKKRAIILILLTVLSILPLLDMFRPGLPVTHDGQDHVARIANFYRSLSEGNIVPRWAGNLNWGYGHPILMFLYPFPSYVASLFHAIGFSFVDSTKLVFAVAFVASILAMYVWVEAAWGMWPAVTAAILYGFAPYRFVDLYVRGAIGEHMAFVFLPVLLLGIYRLAHDRDGRTGFAVTASGTSGLILSHNALSLMFLPIAALYGLYLFFGSAKRATRFLFLAVSGVAMGFLLSAFFWVPALFEGKYTLRDIVTAGQFDSRFVPWSWFLFSPWNYGGSETLSKFLGWAQLSAVAVSVYAAIRLRKHRLFLGGTLAVLLASLFIMTGASGPLWDRVTLIQKFQFPWRFLSVSVFATALLGGLAVFAFPKKHVTLSLVLCAVAVIGTSGMWRAKAYRSYPEGYFTGVYHGTTDTGESSPIWSVRFMESEPNAPIAVIDGEASIIQQERTFTHHGYTVQATSRVRLVENTLYFPGWTVYVDGKPAPVEFQDPQFRGLMTFTVSEGLHTVDVVFGDTRVRATSNLISVAGLMLLAVFLGTMPVWERLQKRA